MAVWVWSTPPKKQPLVKLRRLRLVEISGKFDLVITSHLLEDLSDPQARLGQCLSEKTRIQCSGEPQKNNQGQQVRWEGAVEKFIYFALSF